MFFSLTEGAVSVFLLFHRGRIFQHKAKLQEQKEDSPSSASLSSYSFRIHKLIFQQFYSGTGEWNIIQKLPWTSLGREKYKANALLWLLTVKCLAEGWWQSSHLVVTG